MDTFTKEQVLSAAHAIWKHHLNWANDGHISNAEMLAAHLCIFRYLRELDPTEGLELAFCRYPKVVENGNE